jgi:O-antigen biosynthesis protein
MQKDRLIVKVADTVGLVERLEQQDKYIRALQQSRSWRLTSPLRWLKRVVRDLTNTSPAGSALAPAVLKDYSEWVRQFDSMSGEVSASLIQRMDGFVHAPLFSVLLAINHQNAEAVKAIIESVRQQLYPHWELCIAAGAQTPQDVRAQLAGYAQADSRIKITHSSVADNALLSNQALTLVGDQSCWVVNLYAAFSIASQAMSAMAKAINENKNSQIIYADEDSFEAKGKRTKPDFKPDWNLDLHLSRNLIGHFGIYRTALVQQVGGFQEGMAEAMDFDLSLRCMEQVAPEQIVHLPYVLFHGAASIGSERVASSAGVQALNAHFERQHIAASAANIGHGYRIHYALPKVLPWVSLIIPTRNGLDLLQQCIDSIQQKTTYANFEIIIVDNGSDDPATLAYFKSLEQKPNIRILRIDAPFNYSALNNAAVKESKGELIALINNDIEVISPDWLQEMVSHALRSGVGAVGARLWFPDDTLQHGGVVLGIHGWAAHAHNHLPRGSLGYQGRMALVSEFSAVTGACLLVRKSSYEAVGGLNEEALKISCNDVDFCLKLQKLGLRNVWTPFAELYHHESATRGFEDTPTKKARFAHELAYMRQHWGEALKNDPAYSPNLTLAAQDFGLAWPPRVPSLLRPVTMQPGPPPLYERLAALAKGKMRIAYFAENIHSSTFRYRAANMAQVLDLPDIKHSLETSAACFFSGDLQHTADIVDNADMLVISRARYDLDIAKLIQQFKTLHKKVWFDIDDWVFDTQAVDLIVQTSGQAPTDEVLNYWHAVLSRMARTLCLCDGVITTNEYLANKIRQFVDVPVKIIPNFVNARQLAVSAPLYQHKLTADAAPLERIKLGYFSGSSSHNADVALVASALERVMVADPRVELVLVGHVDVEQAFGVRFGGYLKGHLADRLTIHPFVDFLALQALIADVDFNLVPLLVNEFTHCKSELKFVDAAIVGTLTIASPTFAYAEAIRHGQNGYLAEDEQWEAVLLQAIAARDADPEKHKRMTAAAFQDVQQRFTWQTQRPAILQALEVG